MPTNDFLPFASDSPTYLMPLATYANNATRKQGNTPGPADAATLNRAWRQGSNMASALGAAIINGTPLDALDDGNITVLRNAILALVNTARTPRKLTYTPGSYTWVVPAGVYSARFRAWAGGGGGGGSQGGGSSGGGASGCYVETIVALTPGTTIEIEVGGGGTGGVNNGGSAFANTGVEGDSTTIRLQAGAYYVEAYGGAGGTGSFTSGLGNGGTCTPPVSHGGLLEIQGSFGGLGGTGIGGRGGSAPIGGAGGAYLSSVAYAGLVPAGGGAGGAGTQAGAAGADGLVIIEY